MSEKTRHEVKLGRHDWPDYIVRAWLENEAVVCIEAFDVIGTDENDKPIMLLKGWQSSPDDSTDDPDKAEPFIEGSIKWDGCSHLNFGKDGYIHFCGRTNAVQIGALVDRLYSIAKEMLKPSDEGLFDGTWR